MSEYDPDFIERNGAWLLSLVGILVTCWAGVLAYFLKSRCRTIKCCGFECERDVLDLTSVPESALQVELSQRRASQEIRLPRIVRPKPPSVASTSSDAV